MVLTGSRTEELKAGANVNGKPTRPFQVMRSSTQGLVNSGQGFKTKRSSLTSQCLATVNQAEGCTSNASSSSARPSWLPPPTDAGAARAKKGERTSTASSKSDGANEPGRKSDLLVVPDQRNSKGGPIDTTISTKDRLSARASEQYDPEIQRSLSGRAMRNEANQRFSTRLGIISPADKEIIEARRSKDMITYQAEKSQKDSFWDNVRERLRSLLENTWFDFAMGMCVAFNTITMVLEYELDADSDSWLAIFDHIFLIVFCFELMMRLFVYRRDQFRDAAGLLDVFVVSTGVISQWILPFAASAGSVDLKTLQVLKVLRVARCVRVLRMLTMFKDLWIIVMSFWGCLGALMWTIVFLMIVLFIFGMFGVELIGRSIEFDDLEVQGRFSRPVNAMLCLFQLMSLDNWKEEIVSPLLKTAPWTYIYVLMFIGIGPFALMNLVTAVVVESSVKRVREDKEYQQQIFERNVARRTREIQEFWQFLMEDVKKHQDEEEKGDKDLDDSDIDDDEREMNVDDFLRTAAPHPFLQKQMQIFGMTEAEDFAILFRCLDSDESDSLELSEIIRGVLKLQTLAEDKDTISLIKAAGTAEERRRMFAQEMAAAIEDTHTMLYIVENMIERIDSKLLFVECQRGFSSAACSSRMSPTGSRRNSRLGCSRKSSAHSLKSRIDKNMSPADRKSNAESQRKLGHVLNSMSSGSIKSLGHQSDLLRRQARSAGPQKAVSSDGLSTIIGSIESTTYDDSTAYWSNHSAHHDCANSIWSPVSMVEPVKPSSPTSHPWHLFTPGTAPPQFPGSKNLSEPPQPKDAKAPSKVVHQLQSNTAPSIDQPLEHCLKQIINLHKAHECRLQVTLAKGREAVLSEWRAELAGITSSLGCL